MTEKDIINIIIQALTEHGILNAYHRILNGKGVQVRMTDDSYFNIAMSRLSPGKDYIVNKLKENK